jgi:hypothetical protein
MNIINNEYKKSETFCLTIEKLNSNENISNQSISIISNYLEKYLKLACQHIRREEKSLFEPVDQVKMNTMKIAYPLILVFGLVGNILSFIIMIQVYKRKRRAENRFAINLIALSIADLAVLTFGCFREYSDEVLEWRLRSTNLFFCKFFYFNCYLFSCFSSYLHAFISIERWYAVSNPIKSRISTVRNKRYILIIFSMCFLISLPYVYIAQLKQEVTVNQANLIDVQVANVCEIVQESFFVDLLIAINDYVICCIIPFILAFAFSSLTLLQLFKNKRIKVDHNLEIMTQKLIPNSCSFDDKLTNKASRIISQESELKINNSHSASNLKLTLMLMTLPICYVITNFPIFLILIFQFYTSNAHKPNGDKSELAIAKVFMYTNNSINILFYVFLGKNLKKVLNDLIFKTFSFKFKFISK